MISSDRSPHNTGLQLNGRACAGIGLATACSGRPHLRPKSLGSSTNA